MSPPVPITPERWKGRQDTQRRAGVLERVSETVASIELEIPEPVLEVKRRKRGVAPKLPAEAFELARQVYYLQHGTIADAAKAIVAARLSDTDNETQVYERLQTWWQREEWPKRQMLDTFALRDAAQDGGLYRGRLCKGTTTGKAAAPAGVPCGQSALKGSDYCPHHDPRPKYVEMRRLAAERFRERRLADQVPLKPFQRWLDEGRRRLLREAKANWRVHHNATGWGMLAEELDVDLSQLTRWAHGYKKRGKPVTEIRAKTVVRYLAKVDVTFEDVYGFPPPTLEEDTRERCPECGGPKNAASKTCRTCFEASEGDQCAYVNRAGRRCPVTTAHESGYCCKCRRIVERVPKPRLGLPSFIDDAILLYALDEYRRVDKVAWVAKVLWAANIGGVADHYKATKSLREQLVRVFRKRGWHSKNDVETAYWLLVAEQGSVVWPEQAVLA
jgi:hypothetical protein